MDLSARPRVTFVLTSCGRFDLLERTLAAFFKYNTYPICRYLVIEDSGNELARRVCDRVSSQIEVVVNQHNIGLLPSLDRIYREIGTELIFHCEDDWTFFRRGFIEDSIEVLHDSSLISMVSCRGIGLNSLVNKMYECSERKLVGSVAYRYPARIDTDWAGYSFNPGLRRLSDIKEMGYFAHFKNEREVSRWFLNQGMRIAYLREPACETTAWKNSVHHYRPAKLRDIARYSARIACNKSAFRFREILRMIKLYG